MRCVCPLYPHCRLCWSLASKGPIWQYTAPSRPTSVVHRPVTVPAFGNLLQCLWPRFAVQAITICLLRIQVQRRDSPIAVDRATSAQRTPAAWRVVRLRDRSARETRRDVPHMHARSVDCHRPEASRLLRHRLRARLRNLVPRLC